MHVIVGVNKIYQDYLESCGDEVLINPILDDPDSSYTMNFDLGFICNGDVDYSIKELAPRCKVLVTPKLETFAKWEENKNKYPSCQFVMAKPDLYRPQIETLRDIRLMKNIIHSIQICWDNIIGLIHITHVVSGPLSNPTIHNDAMTFENFGVKTHCREAYQNEIRVNFKDGSNTVHSFTSHSKIADHNMIQDLFKLTKFNPGEYNKHYILDKFVHLLLE